MLLKVLFPNNACGDPVPFLQVRADRENINYKLKRRGPSMGSLRRCVCKKTRPPRGVTVVGGHSYEPPNFFF